MRILLLTGPGGDAQGWGDMKVTESMREATESLGHPTRIAYVADEAEFFRLVDKPDFDIVWSALYHITPNEAFIGRNAAGTWVADVLDERKIPYIGSDSRTMKAMIDKFETHEILAAGGVAVPAHVLLHSGDDASAVTYPAFVKPICESRSVGISDESVVHNEEELRRRVAFIEKEFDEPALVEEFLPGDEYTALVLGNGKTRECLPGLVTVEDTHLQELSHPAERPPGRRPDPDQPGRGEDRGGAGARRRGGRGHGLPRPRPHRHAGRQGGQAPHHRGQRHPRAQAPQELGAADLHALPRLAARGGRGLPAAHRRDRRCGRTALRLL